MRPTVRFLLAHPAHFVALGFGSGLAPKGPGTAGTLAAWLLYPLLRAPLGDAVFLMFLLTAFVFGIIAAERTGRALGVPDHGAIVWDEMVPFWLVLFFTPPTLAWQLAAFALFRVFDILKPPPIAWADRRVKGGFGVMLDDVIAAGYTLLVLAVAARWLET
ncbi:phosphatidylglycerophosphatase A [Nitrogeniibacter mangrovi]|uniref:Phosphatidylglycerophosphatase A n=1 Tax=Nitrogeniibacter mangrovi TaxID=2016596 RepID=A0A6C1B2D7_9RHOO|nr:phosphatidylglycerophosphatase A [Nitrogeniibacter mangrovi]QID16510.1 phosphatidylglycerophosphatase A [Nitrogeniibacter mangrovi]